MRHRSWTVAAGIAVVLAADGLRAHGGSLFRNWGGTSNDAASSVALDNASNIWIAGFFSDTVDFNPAGPAHSNLTSVGNSVDSFVCKYDKDGTFLWARTWGSAQSDRAVCVASDSAGSAYVIGCFKGTVDFNPAGDGPGHTNVTANDQDAYLCKYDKDGHFQWVRHWGGDHGEDGYGLAVDPADNSVYAVGDFSSAAVDFNPEPAPGTDHDWHTNRFSAGYGYDAWLCKWNTDGVFQWARTWGGNGYDDCCTLVADGLGHVFTGGFLGSTNNTCDFNTNTNLPHLAKLLNATPPGGSVTDAFLSMFDTNGVWQWAASWGGSSYDMGGPMAPDGHGGVYVTGYFQTNANNAPVDFNPPGPAHCYLTCRGDGGAGPWGGGDAFLCRYNSDGEFLWAQAWGGTDTDSFTGGAVDPSGYVYVSGVFKSQPCNFSPDPGVTNAISSHGGKDIYLSKFDPDGNLLMVKTCGGATDDWAYATAVDGSGNACLVGGYRGAVDFGPLCGGPIAGSNGGDDAFLCRVHTGPLAAVYGNTTVVTNGDVTPSQAKGTDFGNVSLGSSVYTNTLTITNTGYAVLTLDRITVAANSPGFSADTGGITNIAIGAGAPLYLVFSPWDDTPCSGTVTIADNDAAGGSYTFGIGGCGVAIGPTQFITAASGDHGTISPSGVVPVTGGGKKAFTNVPDACYHVASVVVDGVPQGAPLVYVFTNVMAAHTITNTFAADLATNGTPKWWLSRFGFTNNMDTADVLPGSNGVPLWQSYVADLDPTNPASVLAIVALSNESPNRLVYFSPASTARVYALKYGTNLASGSWTAVTAMTNRGNGSVFRLTDTNASSPRYYQVGVQVP